MPYIEEVRAPYGIDRNGAVARTGPSTESSPGERELFDHSNIWIPGADFRNNGIYFTAVGETFGVPARWFPYGAGRQLTHYTMRRPRKWDDGNLTGRIWHIADADGTSTAVYIGVQIVLRSESGLYDTTYTTFFYELEPCSSATEYRIDRTLEEDTTGKGYVEISSEADLIEINIQRAEDQSEDTFTDSWGLVGFELFYRPRLVESTGLAPWLMKE